LVAAVVVAAEPFSLESAALPFSIQTQLGNEPKSLT
jgi:hypothetical protein